MQLENSYSKISIIYCRIHSKNELSNRMIAWQENAIIFERNINFFSSMEENDQKIFFIASIAMTEASILSSHLSS